MAVGVRTAAQSLPLRLLRPAAAAAAAADPTPCCRFTFYKRAKYYK
jgi:hypothetical protein